MEWTKEYHGVSHLLVPKPYQITMTRLGGSNSRSDRYQVYLLNLNRDVNEKVFTPVNEFTGSKVECIAKGEDWAKTLKEWI